MKETHITKENMLKGISETSVKPIEFFDEDFSDIKVITNGWN